MARRKQKGCISVDRGFWSFRWRESRFPDLKRVMRFRQLRPIRDGEHRDSPPDDIKKLADEIIHAVNDKHTDLRAPILLSGLDVKHYRRPAVYAWKRGAIWLYIGVCVRGIERIFTDHHIIEKKAAIMDGDYFLIYPQEDYASALAAEKAMILEHEPEFNTFLLQRKRRIRKLEKDAKEPQMQEMQPSNLNDFAPIFDQFFPVNAPQT